MLSSSQCKSYLLDRHNPTHNQNLDNIEDTQLHTLDHNSHILGKESGSVLACREFRFPDKIHLLLADSGRFHPCTSHHHLGGKVTIYFLFFGQPRPDTVDPHCPGKAPLHRYSEHFLSLQKVGWEQTLSSFEKKYFWPGRSHLFGPYILPSLPTVLIWHQSSKGRQP